MERTLTCPDCASGLAVRDGTAACDYCGYRSDAAARPKPTQAQQNPPPPPPVSAASGLITECFECGAGVSKEALKCPRCGSVALHGKPCAVCGRPGRKSAMLARNTERIEGHRGEETAYAHEECVRAVLDTGEACEACGNRLAFDPDPTGSDFCASCGHPHRRRLYRCYYCGHRALLDHESTAAWEVLGHFALYDDGYRCGTETRAVSVWAHGACAGWPERAAAREKSAKETAEWQRKEAERELAGLRKAEAKAQQEAEAAAAKLEAAERAARDEEDARKKARAAAASKLAAEAKGRKRELARYVFNFSWANALACLLVSDVVEEWCRACQFKGPFATFMVAKNNWFWTAVGVWAVTSAANGLLAVRRFRAAEDALTPAEPLL